MKFIKIIWKFKNKNNERFFLEFFLSFWFEQQIKKNWVFMRKSYSKYLKDNKERQIKWINKKELANIKWYNNWTTQLATQKLYKTNDYLSSSDRVIEKENHSR